MEDRIVLGGGCFWCVEAVYQKIPGIVGCVSGYAGGNVSNPTYEQVCSGTTGHAEVVEVTFDPATIPLKSVLDVFWKAHDPTTANRQGADVGTQYRSAIYWVREDQKAIVEESVHAARALWSQPLTTELALLDRFWPAETYHQNYYRQHPGQGYCRAVIAPKLKKLGFSEL